MQWVLFDYGDGDQRGSKKCRGREKHEPERLRKISGGRSSVHEPVQGEPGARSMKAAEHDCGENRNYDRAAECPEEIKRAGRDAELVRQDGILNDDIGPMPAPASANSAATSPSERVAGKAANARSAETAIGMATTGTRL